ncbi:hypothetical protein SAMN05428988_5413 [Chitinophaga sp. YR573]|nr:hypothetical protein SAMN05428988_5413 [Chitinophaga sp. YR573]
MLSLFYVLPVAKAQTNVFPATGTVGVSMLAPRATVNTKVS